MLKKLSEQNFFEEFIRLHGKKIKVSQKSTGKELEGIVSNSMFDSFILHSKNGNVIIRFDDILFFEKSDD